MFAERLCSMYESATEQIKVEKEEYKSFRLATVSALFSDGCPKITFFGEETASEKKYKIIDGTSYEIGDTALVGIVNDGYVILGTVSYSTDSGGTTVYLTEAQANLLYATKTHTHSEYASSSHTHDRVQTGSFSLRFTTIAGSPYGYYFAPSSDNYCDLGSSSYRMRTIYAATSTISTSDRKKKKLIETLDERYMKFFRLLKPRRYKFKDGSSDRYHTGIIAQDVEKALKEAGLTDLDFAGFIKSPRYNKKGKQLKGYDYGLRYEEFIPITAMAVQEVLKVVDMQAEHIDKLEKRIEQLERRLSDA